MRDQAEGLRRKMEQKENRLRKTIAVVSGKGGVGKSNFSLNFSISLSMKGNKVLLFDMDIGMGNIDILIGKSSHYSIVDFFHKRIPLRTIVNDGPNGLHYIAGGTGLEQLLHFDQVRLIEFTNELQELLYDYDYVIFDMGAGVSEHSLHFIMSVDEIFVITTPEPTSITDAYAMMKHIHLKNHQGPFYVVVNRIRRLKEGVGAYQRLDAVAKQFLQRELKSLGYIHDDISIQKAVIQQTPFILNRHSSGAKDLEKIVSEYLNKNYRSNVNIKSSFIGKIKRFLFER